MGKQVTLGGDRVGSGKKMQANLHDYYRSTHNLSEKFASSIASGVLYPAMVKLGMRGDAFDIKIDADARTIPTLGPLFGTFKMQVDVFQCPVRLYQAILHNNPLAIGLNMSQVKFPKLVINSRHDANGDYNKETRFSPSCLLKYLGMSGLGRSSIKGSANTIGRKINAIPALAYYDIFKTYYANKQEGSAYVITGSEVEKTIGTYGSWYTFNDSQQRDYDQTYEKTDGYQMQGKYEMTFTDLDQLIENASMTNDLMVIEYTHGGTSSEFSIGISDIPQKIGTRKKDYKYIDDLITEAGVEIIIYRDNVNHATIEILNFTSSPNEIDTITIYEQSIDIEVKKRVALQPFNITNIDDMRYDILSMHTLGATFEIKDSNAYLPYSTLVEQLSSDSLTYNTMPMNGLVLKTYQNDIFNNWLNTEWIEGENGIAEMSAIAVSDGKIKVDAVNFGFKLYNMLNRIAVSGGTYEDWQDVVYEEVKRRQIESPIFVGGMSKEVVFDEIVQTTRGEGVQGDTLGTLAGRGRLSQEQKGGTIHIKCDEACFIIAIVSLTPRIYYTQGNEFYMTELDSMDDLHKPAMDGIGFQDLIGERMAWWDTVITANTTAVNTRTKIGKLPAWIDYMTSVDKAYGDFAEQGGNGFMILNRNYEVDETTGGIKDATTYVDPSKYNYAFAYDALDAQNFWIQINFNIKARRLMSARLIPNV